MSPGKIFGMVTTTASQAYTRIALESFFAHTHLDDSDTFLLFDNDNSFTDELPPQVTLITNPYPLGFAANVNQAMRRALEKKADLFFLNNDLVFTRGWLQPLLAPEAAILSPLSNREVQYAASVHVVKTASISNLFVCTQRMRLEDYEGNQAALAAIVEAHQKKTFGSWSVYVVPFFCVKLPLVVMQTLGLFDESFGKAGGEDYDYCLRAHLAGLDVRYQCDAYVLHFYGKSSWDGVETEAEKELRISAFKSVFRNKWGDPLFELVLHEQTKILDEEQQRTGSCELTKPEMIKRLLGDRQVQLKIEP